jgi:glycosyltransferase involved in cell wall biosynthesis
MSAGSPKTVLYVVDGLGLSGKTRTLAYLASHLDPRRFRAAVCTFSAETGILADQLTSKGVTIHTLACRDGLDFRVALRLARLMRSARVDVVHCYNPRPMLYGGVAAKLLGIGATIGSLSAFACQLPDQQYDFLPQALSTSSRRNVYRNRIATRLMRYVVTVSASLGKRFCEYNALPAHKFRVVPYGADLHAAEQVTVDETASLRRRMGFSRDDIVIGSVGRLVEQKDYPTQLKAFALAAAEVPRLRMVLAGDGPLEAELRDTARALGIQDRVRFLGHWDEIPPLLQSLDIFVLSSKFEPFGVALLEAKAAGLPVVATRVNEIPEIVSDGESGLLSPPEDPVSLASLLVKLATEPSLRARLGQQARIEARARHGYDAIVSAYQALYDSSLN